LMSSWRVESNGSVNHLDEEPSGFTANEVSLAVVRPRLSSPVPTALVATTVQAGDGHAQVITWQVVLTDGSISPAGGDSDNPPNRIGDATQIASALAPSGPPSGHLIVSCRNGSGNLQLIPLLISGTGDTVTRILDGGNEAGEVSLNALTTRPQG